jgi:hypothetical protein
MPDTTYWHDEDAVEVLSAVGAHPDHVNVTHNLASPAQIPPGMLRETLGSDQDWKNAASRRYKCDGMPRTSRKRLVPTVKHVR